MEKYYRVTEVIAGTQSEEKRKALIKWQKTLEKKLGIENAEQERQDILNKGTRVHASIEKYLRINPEIDPEIAHLKPFLNLLLSYDLIIEKRFWSKEWRLTGQIDLIFENLEDGVTILDWTTSGKFKKRAWIDEKFIQMGGYTLLYPKKVDLLTCVVVRPHTYQIFEETDVLKYQALFMERLQRFLQGKLEEEGKEIKGAIFDF